MEQVALTAAASLILLTMCLHSILGQRRLIRPLLKESDGVMRHSLARFVVPFAWHLTSLIGVVLASILLAWAWAPDQARSIGLAMTAAVFICSGLFDAVGSRGRHVGWAPLTLIGIASMAGLIFG